jgi:sugar phosphate permease
MPEAYGNQMFAALAPVAEPFPGGTVDHSTPTRPSVAATGLHGDVARAVAGGPPGGADSDGRHPRAGQGRDGAGVPLSGPGTDGHGRLIGPDAGRWSAVGVELTEAPLAAVGAAPNLGRVSIQSPAQTSRRRWVMLGLGTAAQAVASCLLFGLPFLLPYLRRSERLTLAQGGALVAAPSLGMVVTLIAWGAFADRYGERLAITLGLGLTGVLGIASAATSSLSGRAVLFALVGAAGAAVSSASGRLVMGWFGVHERGLAMGIRQTGQPLGIALAGALLPPLAGWGGLRLALGVPAAICLVLTAAVLLFAADPPGQRPAQQPGHPRPRSPYRRLILWRVHAASSLLVVPQFATLAFSAEYLVSERGWDATTAGQLLAVVAVGGAAGRMAAGRWSDLARSRLAPMRVIALMSCGSMLVLALTASTGVSLVVLALAVASIVSVSDNGLGFTATAELAGRAWSGRALGVQNTMQNVAAFATAPLVGAFAGSFGFAWAFAAVAAFPVLGAWMTPVEGERRALSAGG